MNRDLTPTEGARYLLERTADHASRADYALAIFTPDATYRGSATLCDDGSVTLGSLGAPAELEARMLSIAKLVARDAGKLRDDGMPPWPARILRWRKS